MKLTFRQTVLNGLLALHAKRYRKELAYFLAGVAICLRLVPSVGPSLPTKAWHIPLAFLGLIAFLLLLAPLLNMLQGSIQAVGTMPAGVPLTALGILFSLAMRRKGRRYLQAVLQASAAQQGL